MGKRGAGSELPQELWSMIVKRLNSDIDVLRFRSICQSSRVSVPPSIRSLPPVPPRIKTPFGTNSLVQTTIYRLQPSHLPRTLTISSDSSASKGWLIKVREFNYRRLCLLDPFTNSRRRYPCGFLPRKLNLLDFSFVELVKQYSLKYVGGGRTRKPSLPQIGNVFKAALFPNLACAEVENCMVFSVHEDGKLGVSKIGGDNWTLVDDKNFYYDDVIVHKGQLYVVDKWGTISWIDYSSMKLVQFSPPLCGFGKKKHLVESDGSLYVVDMYFKGEPHSPKGSYYEAVDVKVYKLDEEWGRWLDVKNLGDRVFVLGKDGNLSLSARDYHCCEQNSIYFCYRNTASRFSLESSTCQPSKVFWPCPSLFDP